MRCVGECIVHTNTHKTKLPGSPLCCTGSLWTAQQFRYTGHRKTKKERWCCLFLDSDPVMTGPASGKILWMCHPEYQYDHSYNWYDSWKYDFIPPCFMFAQWFTAELQFFFLYDMSESGGSRLWRHYFSIRRADGQTLLLISLLLLCCCRVGIHTMLFLSMSDSSSLSIRWWHSCWEGLSD